MDKAKARPYFLLGLLAISSFLAFLIFRPFLAPLALALVFAVILRPLYKKISKQMGTWDGVAAFITVLISLVCIILPLAFISTQVIGEGQQLYVSLSSGAAQAHINDVIDATNSFFGGHVPGLLSLRSHLNADALIRQGIDWIVANLGVAVTGIVSTVLNLFVFVFALYFFLRDGQKFKSAIVYLSPLKDSDEELVFTRLELAINSVVKGSLFVAVVQGTLTAIGFTIFGVPNGILWGSVTFFASLIPGLGTALVLIPSIAYLFLIGHIPQAIGLTAWGSLWVASIDNFLGPRLVSHGTQLHPLLILLAVLGGVAFFGPIGIFLGPLSVSLLFALLSIYTADSST